jgi:hypothetical protein
MDLPKARRVLSSLRSDLQQITAKDPEQELQGIALPAVDAALSSIRGLLPDGPVLSRVDDLISPATIEAGEPVRAVDVPNTANGEDSSILGGEKSLCEPKLCHIP